MKKLRALDPTLYSISIEDDILHKESEFVDNFYKLITESVEPPFAISVDGLWGTGKTTVMKLLEKRLRDANYSTFWFNPWEYRKTENVVFAFLQCLAGEYKDKVKKLEKSGVKILHVLLHAGIGAALKIYTQGNVSLKDIKDYFNEIEKGDKAVFEDYKNSVEAVKEDFKELINSFGTKEKPAIIFFDDLDRCLPDDAIQLLEALKNLFVTPECNAVFICGIDTRVAKQFISKHYNEIEEMFAINYFRKIFNLTISMPYSPDIEELLKAYINKLYRKEDGNYENDMDENQLSTIVSNEGKKAKLSSVRKYLNIINNFYVFQRFNPEFVFDPENKKENNLVIYLLMLKEIRQPLYENLIQEALKNEYEGLRQLIESLPSEEKDFLLGYFFQEDLFAGLSLSEWIVKYPTLA